MQKVQTSKKKKKITESELQVQFNSQRKDLKQHDKHHIFKLQQENSETYNLRRTETKSYQVGCLVGIKRTQFGFHLSLKEKYFGSHRITKLKDCDTYDVIEEECYESSQCTTACAKSLRNWTDIDTLKKRQTFYL